MSIALTTRGLGKRYGRRWALSDCSLELPAGHVAGLVGPNGAGKTTLLELAVGLIEPSAGSIAVLGGETSATAEQLARIGFVAQQMPLYASLSVAEHLRLGAALNPRWDAALAQSRIDRLDLDPSAARRHAIGRAARAARADAGDRQAARAARARRAGRRP